MPIISKYCPKNKSSTHNLNILKTLIFISRKGTEEKTLEPVVELSKIERYQWSLGGMKSWIGIMKSLFSKEPKKTTKS